MACESTHHMIDAHDWWGGRRVYVTGITGSWGTELCRQLTSAGAAVVGYSRDELKQSQMARQYPSATMVLGDVRDRDRLAYTMRGADTVIHLAALKQVAAGEAAPGEFVRTNILGTENVAHAAIANAVPRLMFVSSDKAVAPTTLYGGTKFVAERIISHIDPTITAATTCRFGNALGSRGSVLPIWRQQIADQIPITITDPACTRYIISLADACAYVLRIAALPDAGPIRIPDMPSCTITALAACYTPNYPTQITGGRGAGEKTHEVLEIGSRGSDDPASLIEGADLRAVLIAAGWPPVEGGAACSG
jgi:UDP-N-acetylglucosamine 4,6-dehydratase